MNFIYILLFLFFCSEPMCDNWDNWTIVFCTLRAWGDDESIEVSKNNYSIIINIYSINIQSFISYHSSLTFLGKKMHCPLSQLSRTDNLILL